MVVALPVLAAVAAAPASASATSEFPWDKRVKSATAFGKARTGRVAFAVVDPDGHVRGYHIHERHYSASVVKAMLLVAYLRRDSVRDQPLRASDRALLHPMITRSDNDAASRVRATVGNAGLAKLARRAEMKDFATASVWGSTWISAYDQSRFFFSLDEYVPRRHRAYARSLLAGVIPAQRWGLPRVVPNGWTIFLKGGWRRLGGQRLVNQIGLLEHGDTRIAIAVLTDGDPSYPYGHETIRGVGERLMQGLNELVT